MSVRAGRHDCFDRLVIQVSDHYRVGYVPVVPGQATGDPVRLRGGAFLEIVVGAADDPSTGAPTYRPANRRELVDVTGYRTFRQVAWGGSFEGVSTIGLGVRARLPFRVFTLVGPGRQSRVVIDVAHQW